MYKEGKVKIFNSLNNCLQDVLELTPAIDLITLFCILTILILMVGVNSWDFVMQF